MFLSFYLSIIDVYQLFYVSAQTLNCSLVVMEIKNAKTSNYYCFSKLNDILWS
jgi:hypothetical protein